MIKPFSHNIHAGINYIDFKVSQAYLRIWKDHPSLIVLLFHILFRNDHEINRHQVYPVIGMTCQHLCEIIEYFLQHHYIFISPDAILQGLKPNQRYILITFDDGYFNSNRVLPILKEYQIPAVFFISSNYVCSGHSFWWDIVYRENHRKGKNAKEIDEEITRLKSMTHHQINQYIQRVYPTDAHQPLGDLDRPFTPVELKDFANEPFVHLGNHTSDHAILTNYSPTEIREQIVTAQHAIHDMTRIVPFIISYPNGNYSQDILDIARESGLEMGISVDPHKNHLPLESSESLMSLGRFMPLGHKAIHNQCDIYRSDIILSQSIRNWMRK